MCGKVGYPWPVRERHVNVDDQHINQHMCEPACEHVYYFKCVESRFGF